MGADYRLLVLDISEKQLVGPLSSLSNCSELLFLLCFDNALTSIPDLSNLSKLMTLKCNSNQISSIGSLDNCSQLQQIICWNNQLSSLPSLDDCAALKELRCYNNLLTNIPPLGSNVNLEVVQVYNNLLTSFPPISGANNLATLACYNNQISSMGPLVGCPNLETLLCQNNQLISLPSLDDCASLTYLDCSNNLLTGMPSLHTLSNLEILLCHTNQLTGLPALGVQTKLQILECQNNNLSILPSLNSCTSLTTLSCQNNQLISLPSMTQCGALTTLACQGNYLMNFPDLSGCTNLQQIECGSNDLNFDDFEELTSYYTGVLNVLPLDTLAFAKDSLLLLDTDSYVLMADGAGGQQTNYVWERDGIPIPGATNNTLTVTAAMGNGFYRCKAHNSSVPTAEILYYPSNIYFDEGVVCGNTNRDQSWDMLDLAPIGIHYNVTGSPRPNWQFETGDSIPHPAYDWVKNSGAPLTYTYGGNTVNLKNADCNGDGKLDSLDVDCIRNYYQPLSLPSFLTSNIQSTFKLKATPQDSLIDKVGTNKVRVPFRISLEELPVGMDSILIKGVVFTRPVAESEHYRVDTIFVDFTYSDLVPNPNEGLALQVFHEHLNVGFYPDTTNFPCMDAIDHPLDVGVFNKYQSRYMSRGHSALDCIVIIEDVFRVDNPNNDTIAMVPLVLHTYNVVVYTEDALGNSIPLATECTSDTTLLDIDELYVRNIILPLEVGYFDGYRANNVSYINWATEQEVNTSHFLLERSVDGGKQFEQAAIVQASGYSDVQKAYHFADTEEVAASNGKVVYRLTGIDLDGTQHFLGRIELSIHDELVDGRISVYPNPASPEEALSVIMESELEADVIIELIDMKGRILYAESKTIGAGKEEHHLDAPTTKGIYFVRIRGDLYSTPQKIIIE